MPKDDFERLAAARRQLAQRLSASTLGVLRQAVSSGCGEVCAASLGIAGLAHFLYLDRAASCYVCARFPPEEGGPDRRPDRQQGGGGAQAVAAAAPAGGAAPPGAPRSRAGGSGGASEGGCLLDSYARLHAALHASSPPLAVLFVADGRRALLGHACAEYELYTAHSPLCARAEAAAAAQALLGWLRKERAVLLLERQLSWPG